MGQIIKLLWEAVSGWIPFPEGRVEVAPTIFYPLFGLLVLVFVTRTALEMREEYRKAKSQGEAERKLHVWTTIVVTLVIGAIGWWFITG